MKNEYFRNAWSEKKNARTRLLCVSCFPFSVAVALLLGTWAHLAGAEQLGLGLCLETLKGKNSVGKQHISSQLQLLPHVNLISTSQIAGTFSHTSQTPSPSIPSGYGLRFFFFVLFFLFEDAVEIAALLGLMLHWCLLP